MLVCCKATILRVVWTFIKVARKYVSVPSPKHENRQQGVKAARLQNTQNEKTLAVPKTAGLVQ